LLPRALRASPFDERGRPQTEERIDRVGGRGVTVVRTVFTAVEPAANDTAPVPDDARPSMPKPAPLAPSVPSVSLDEMRGVTRAPAPVPAKSAVEPLTATCAACTSP
jgi:hypothetical protein